MNQPILSDVQAVTFRQLIDNSAKEYGSNPSVLYVNDRNETITKTYSDFQRDSYYAAYQLASMFGSGTHIGICAEKNYPLLCYLNGILISSNVLIPIQQNIEREKMLTLIHQADITVMIMDQNTADRLGAIDGIQIIILPDEISAHSPVALGEDDPERLALIMFTSGTTSDKMKGVMLTHKALITNVFSRVEKNKMGQVTLSVLPLHHIFGFAVDYLDNITDGVAMFINNNLDTLAENLLRYRPHYLHLVPMMAEGLLRKVRITQRLHPEFSPRDAAEAVFGNRIGLIITAGAKLPAYVGAEYAALGIRIQQGYGMTETGPRIAVPDDKIDPNAAGNIIPCCQTRFEDGELQIKSPCVMLGYYKDEEETAKVFTEDGWFRTGDVGYITDEKRLYITGRLKNLIIRSNGENISPEEIEKQFVEHPFVTEVMVYEEKDKIVAECFPDKYYVKKNGIADSKVYFKKLVAQTNEVLSSEKAVQVIKLRSEPFPRTSSGKLIRKKVEFH